MQNGKVYNLVLASCMPTVQAFTKWKDGQRAALVDVAKDLERSLGTPLAESILGTMECCEKDGIPSVQVLTGDAILHLPPKIAYLIHLSCLDREDILESFYRYLQEKPVAGRFILAEMAMGKVRLETVCCVELCDLSYAFSRMSAAGGDAMRITLADVQFVRADASWFTRTVQGIELLQARGKLTKEMVGKILAAEDGFGPYKGFGASYIDGSENPVIPEAAVPLGPVTEGSVLEIYGSR